jgi:2-iminobutanoate/2-iminopropanoate deaminase
VFCSGTVGIDPQTGSLPDGVAEQTEQALLNLAAILEAAGSSIAQLVKTTIIYTNVEDFATINEVYAPTCPILRQPGRLQPMWPCREVS